MLYVYALADPITGEIRYIGQTNNPRKRWGAHHDKSITANRHVRNWIDKIKRSGQKAEMIILHETESREECDDLEILEIANLKEKIGKRCLNKATGGSVNRGFTVEDDTRTKQRVSRIKYTDWRTARKQEIREILETETNPQVARSLREELEHLTHRVPDETRKAHAEYIETIRGKPIPHLNNPETQEKRRQTYLKNGHTLSEEHLEKLRQANLGKKQSEETIEKRAKKLRGRKDSEEVKEKKSEAAKKRVEGQGMNPDLYSEETNSRRSESLKDSWQSGKRKYVPPADPEAANKKRSESLKGGKHSEETKAKRKESNQINGLIKIFWSDIKEMEQMSPEDFAPAPRGSRMVYLENNKYRYKKIITDPEQRKL